MERLILEVAQDLLDFADMAIMDLEMAKITMRIQAARLIEIVEREGRKK